MTVSDAQRRANAKQDAARKRVAIWLDEADRRALEHVMRQARLTTRIAALRWLIARAKGER